jgi:uncharacterized protein
MEVHGAVEVAIVGDPAGADFRTLTRELGAAYVPALVVAGGRGEDGARIPLLEGREALNGVATAYVCRGYTCDLPATSAEVLREQLQRAGRAQGVGAAGEPA